MWQTEIGKKNQNFEKKLLEILSFYTCVQKPQSYEVWFLRIEASQTEFSVILGDLLPFYTPNNLENQNFEKMNKI